MDDTTSPQGPGDVRLDNLDLGNLILDAPGFLLAVVDQNNRLARTNANLEKTSGFSSQELRGKRLQSLVLEPLAELLKRVRTSGAAEEMVTHLNQADGETIRVRWRFTALPEPAGWVMAAGAALPRAEEQAGPFPSQPAFLRKLLETEVGYIHIYDLEQARFVYSNLSLADFLGYTTERLPKNGGDLFQALLHPNDTAPLQAYLEQLKNAPEGKIFEIEYRLRHADGTYHWILNRATPYSRDPGGRVSLIMGIGQDITPHRTVEELHLRLVEIVETTPDVIATIRPDGTLVYMNWAGRELLGLHLQDVTGYSLRDITPPDVTEQILLESIPAAVHDGSWTGEAAFTSEGDEEVAVSLVLVAHPTDSAEVAYLSFIARDMRETRRMEGELRRSRDELELRVAERTAELHRSEELYRTLAEAAPDMIYVLSRDGQIEYINHAAAAQFNRPVEDLHGRFITELYPVDAALQEQRRVLQVCASGSLQAYENKIHFPGGDRWLSTILAPIRGPDGSVDTVLGVSRDVTARRQIEDELYQSRHMLQLILDNIPQRVFWKDRDSRFLGGNRSFLQDAGLETLEQLLGKDDYALQWASMADQYRADDRQVMESGQEKLNYEEPQTKQTGETFWLRTSKIPLRDRDGQVFGVLGSYEDITARKHAEMLLDARNKELTRSNADLEQFAYIASHDLQEPLRMVTSFAQLISRRYRASLDERGQKYLSYVVDGAYRMQQLIDDLLTYSRVGTRGRVIGPVNCNQVAAQALFNLQVAVRETGANLRIDPLPTLQADEIQILQLFQNLMGNAIKFHAEAAPEVHIWAERDASAWRFAVADNGIGIDPQFAERVFVIFQRLRSRDEYPGTGIGLAVCKKIVERHGGQIWFESTPGKGTTFFFTIPDQQVGVL